MPAVAQNTDFRSINKQNNQEETVVVLQRFLNLYRQSHIFSKAEKEDFNNKLLQLKPEIRGSFSSLPGGSALQEYVNNLEQEKGIPHARGSLNIVKNSSKSEMSDEIEKAKILASALAEANIINPNAQNQQPLVKQYGPSIEELNAEVETLKKQMLKAKDANDIKRMKQIQQRYLEIKKQKEILLKNPPVSTNIQPLQAPVTSNIVLNENFAQSLAEAFAKAISPMEEKRQKESIALTNSIKETQLELAKIIAANNNNVVATNQENHGLSLQNDASFIQAFKDTQLEVAKMLIQHNNSSAAAANNANNIQINNVPTNMPDIERIVESIMSSQSELFKEMISSQTQEFSAIISLALKESQQASTQSIIETIKALHESEPAKDSDIKKENNEQKPDFVEKHHPKEETKQKSTPITDNVPETIEKNSIIDNTTIVDEPIKKEVAKEDVWDEVAQKGEDNAKELEKTEIQPTFKNDKPNNISEDDDLLFSDVLQSADEQEITDEELIFDENFDIQAEDHEISTDLDDLLEYEQQHLAKDQENEETHSQELLLDDFDIEEKADSTTQNNISTLLDMAFDDNTKSEDLETEDNTLAKQDEDNDFINEELSENTDNSSDDQKIVEKKNKADTEIAETNQNKKKKKHKKSIFNDYEIKVFEVAENNNNILEEKHFEELQDPVLEQNNEDIFEEENLSSDEEYEYVYEEDTAEEQSQTKENKSPTNKLNEWGEKLKEKTSQTTHSLMGKLQQKYQRLMPNKQKNKSDNNPNTTSDAS